ncbi:hypothetical protein BGW38_005358 [Lunasporangiospora selenospora]|uniref:E3 ubiquitin-protein ligase listerin n=1 Tax=Lunasporangiospora selenospora TaxID=979761 RepID=A0A9P6KIQ9_9FUNG|nr:hypothetical protein BGW38_005358 [Lunasporangiospora selenospora]
MPPKTTPRVKGNVRSANSSRAAEVASASSTGSALPISALGGFAQFASPSFTASSTYVASSPSRSVSSNRSGSPSSPSISSAGTFGAPDMDMVNVIRNGELSMIVKRLMSKRDTTTKVRALDDLEKWIKAQPIDEPTNSDDATGSAPKQQTSAACQEAIGPWVKLYIKLTTDVDRRVRLMTNNVHALLVKRVGKKLAPYLKEVIAAWIGTFFDPTRDVARVAMESFKGAFPDSKQEQVISFCLQDIIYYISEVLLEKTPETLSDPRFSSKEEMDTRYARVASSSLYTIGYITESLSSEALEKESAALNQLLDEGKLWAFLSHSNPTIRKATYSMLRTVTTKAPHLIKEHLQLVSKHFFPAVFSDKDTTTHGDLWDSVIVFTKAFPNSWALQADPKKPTMTLFMGFLKAAGYGSVLTTYRSILPLISTWTDESVLGKNGTGFPFVKDFFDNFWKGLESPNIDKEPGSTPLFVEAYVECLVYFIVRFGKSEATKQGQDAALSAFSSFVKVYVTSTENGRLAIKFKEAEHVIAEKISVHLVRLLNIPSVRERATSEVWQPTVEAMVELLSDEPTSETYVRRGKRAVLLLSQVSQLSQEKNDITVAELSEKAAEQLVQIVAKQCSQTHAFGPSQILSSLAIQFEVAVFSNPESQVALQDFFSLQFPDMLFASEAHLNANNSLPENGESLTHLLDLFISFLNNSKEQQKALETWQKVMSSIMEVRGGDGDQDRRRQILQNLFSRSMASPPAFSLHLELIDNYLQSIVNSQEYSDLMDSENLIIGALNSSLIITNDVKLSIVDQLSERLKAFMLSLHSDQATDMRNEAQSILRIFSATLSSVTSLAINSGSETGLKKIAVAVFELSFQPDEQLKAIGQATLDELQMLSENTEDLQLMLKESLSEHIKHSIQDLKHFASPEDLATQAQKLADLLNLTDVTERFGLLNTFFFDENHWKALYYTLVKSGPHPSLAVVDPVVEAFYIQDKKGVLPHGNDSNNAYDGFGLSTYGRLALFSFELLKKEDSMISLFLAFPQKTMWIMSELLKVRQGCLDSLLAPSTDRGVFFSPTVHSDANGVVFRTLLREMGSLVTNWITLVLDEPWESNTIEALMKGPQPITNECMDDEDETLHSPVYFAQAALSEQDGFQEHPLSVATGLVMALKARLANTNEFTNLLNFWASELGATQSSQVSAENTVFLRRLTLLTVAMTIDSDEGSDTPSLPQHRVINLLQTVRRWVSDAEALQRFQEKGELSIDSLLLQLLNAVANHVQEIAGAHWEMMFEFVSSILSAFVETAEKEQENQVPKDSMGPFFTLVLERACRLVTNLIELGHDEYDIQNAWEDHSDNITLKAMRLIGLVGSRTNEASMSRMDRPVRQCLEVLSQVCAQASDKTVVSFGVLKEHCRLLQDPVPALQLLAYRQLQTILAEQVQELSVQMEIKALKSPSMDSEEEAQAARDIDAEDKMTSAKFPAPLWEILSNLPRGFPAMDVDVDAEDNTDFKETFSLLNSSPLSGHEHEDEEEEEYGVGAGVATRAEKQTSHQVLGYLLAWKLAFGVFDNTTYTVKSVLVEQLRSAAVMGEFLPYLFHLLGIYSASSLLNSVDQNSAAGSVIGSPSGSTLVASESHGSRGRKQVTEAFDLSRWDISDYQVTGFDMSSPEIGFPLLAGHLYYICLSNVPSLVRIWWTECKMRQLSIAVDNLTERHFSPLLVARELDSLAAATGQQGVKPDGKSVAATQAAALSGVSDELKQLQVKTSKATSEVTASFQIDEATMEIVIRMPTNFPLRQVEVEGLQRVGVKEARWRAWLLSVAGVIAAQNGSLIDALSMFRKNVGLHFEGVEDCTICYSVVSLQDRSLPNKTCKTCKHKFHASLVPHIKLFKLSLV